MATTVAKLAELVGGEVLGDSTVSIHAAATLDDARAGAITLIDAVDKAERLAQSKASAAVVPQGTGPQAIPTVVVDDVHCAFIAVVEHLRPPRIEPRIGISPAAVIDPTAKLATDVDVHPGATIGPDVEIGTGTTIHAGVHVMADCRIGEYVTIMPAAVLYERTRLGDRVTVHAGAVLGAYGFGYESASGRHQRTAQLGHVEIGNDVEIGANATIDRGTYGPTTIGEGTKIDNLVMIAHNCRIGRHNMICSQVGIAGSTLTDDYVVMAGQVGVRDHVHIGQGAILGAMAGITNDVPAGVQMIGIPATPEREQKLKQAALSKLPEMRRQLRALSRVVEKLQQQSSSEPRADAA